MPPTITIDPNLYNYCTPRQREMLEAIELHGGARAASIAMGINIGGASDAYLAVKKKAAGLCHQGRVDLLQLRRQAIRPVGQSVANA